MDWADVLAISISAFLSGFFGVLVSIWYHRNNEVKRAKIRVFQQLLGNRNDVKREKFSEALNQIFVVFFMIPKMLSLL